MALSAHYLGRHVPRGATCVLPIVFPEFPRYSKIGYAEVALLLKHYIFRLNVPVEELVFVNMLQSHEETGCEELRLGFRELLLAAEMEPEVSPGD